MEIFINKPEIRGKDVTLLLDEQVLPKQTGWNPYYIYKIKENIDNQIVGTIVFRLGSKEEMMYSGHIGYHIDEEFRGHSYAYKAYVLLLELIKEHDYQEIVITCQSDNMASIKTISKLPIISFEDKIIPKELRKEYKNKERMNVYIIKVG